VSGGLRYDYRKITNDELYTKSNATSGFDQPVTGVDTVGANKLFSNYSTNFKGVTGSIGLSYSVDKNWAVKFNFARGYRAPNISEISANGVHPGTGFYQIGNAQFKPEFSNQVDIGASYTSSTISAGASLFINQIDNYIYNERLLSAAGGDSLSASGVQVYPTYKFKSGKVLLYGVEGNIDFHIIKPLHFDNSVSLIYGDNKSFIGAEKRDDNKYVPLIPPFRYISELRYDLAQNSKCLNEPFIKLQVQCTAAQNRVFSYDNTETATQGYTLINIGVGTGFKNKAGKTVLNVYVLANNVFDVAFQDHLSRLKYFEQYSASPNGHLGIYNVGRNISLKLVKDF
jgi:iron complex outermembrane receptor protein